METNCKHQVVAWLFGNERYPHAVFTLDSLTIETIKPNVYCQNLKNSANIFPLTKAKCSSGSKRFSYGTHLEKMSDLIWSCPKCGGSNDRVEAVPGSRKFWLFGKRRTKLIAIFIDCWAKMDFVGTV